MSEPTPAAALCRSCNKEPAGDGGIGPACRARAAAAVAAMEAAARQKADAEAAARAAKRKPGRPTKAQAEAEAAGNRLAGDLARLLGKPPPAPLVPDDYLEGILAHEPDPPPHVPERIRVAAARLKSSGLVAPRAQTCCQCPRERPFPPDPDNTPARCGKCVRQNRADLRGFSSR